MNIYRSGTGPPFTPAAGHTARYLTRTRPVRIRGYPGTGSAPAVPEQELQDLHDQAVATGLLHAGTA